MALEITPDFREAAQAKKLDRYYIPTRYPNGLPGVSLHGTLMIRKKQKRQWSLPKA